MKNKKVKLKPTKKCRECSKKLSTRNKTGFCLNCLKEHRSGIGGVPTKMTKDVRDKLEQAFSIGATDIEACLFANVSKDSFYRYCAKNPKFRYRKDMLKQEPILIAKTNIIQRLRRKDIGTTKWYLERKLKEEFSTKQKIEYDGELKINWHEEKTYKK